METPKPSGTRQPQDKDENKAQENSGHVETRIESNVPQELGAEPVQPGTSAGTGLRTYIRRGSGSNACANPGTNARSHSAVNAAARREM